MKMSDQLKSLVETLLSIRNDRYLDVPESLIREIVSAHAREPDDPTIHRRIQQAIENSLDGRDASD